MLDDNSPFYLPNFPLNMISAQLIKEIYPLLRTLVHEIRYNPDLMNDLSELWAVYQKASTGEDKRYQTLGDEIEKHFILNEDWSEDKLLKSILKVTEERNLFLNFLERIINYRANRDKQAEIIGRIKVLLEKERLTIVENDDVLRIESLDSIRLRTNNFTPFIRCNSEIVTYSNFTEENIEWPNETDCFVLTHNYAWNDFGYFTWFALRYIDKDGHKHYIGTVKIMKRGCDNTSNVLEQRFFSLPEEYCSLGFDVSYYQDLKKVLGNKAYDCLVALRDVACFSSIHEAFEKEKVFIHSLCRFNSSEKALREGRYFVNGRDIKDAYSFTFKYSPKYKDTGEEDNVIDFNFAYQCKPYKRIIGLIGENGVGKTTLINDMVDALVKNKKEGFEGLRPIFSQVIIVSYSPFDHFPPNGTNYIMGYKYCGLLKGQNELLSLDEQVKHLIDNIKKIIEREQSDYLMTIWKEIMLEVFPINTIRTIYQDKAVDEEGTKNVCKRMSSGETMFIFSISDILANIRNDTLLFFDEPEQHLHPHAISQLLKAVFEILEKFQSYAIIATHSALVVREMVAENVYVFNRNLNTLNVSKIGYECFGEDISVISDVIFKNLNDEKRYEKFIADTAEKCAWDYDRTLAALQLHGKISLNLRLIISNIINQHQD